MSDLIERTALSPFNLGDKPIRAGQIVTLDHIQLSKLARAGCVALTDEENAAVPVAGLPTTQRSDVDFSADIEEAAANAAKQIAEIRKTVDDARTDADGELGEIRDRVGKALEEADRSAREHADRARLAGEDADRTIEGIFERLRKAGEDADREIAAHNARVAEATAKASNPDATVDVPDGSGETPAAAVAAKASKPKG